jgi:tetratricopeptide (TPR) repeat protein
MTDSVFGSGWRALLLVGLSVVGITLTVRAERDSESRANRLHRADRLEEAAEIYFDRTAADSTGERLRYNLGTTLLRQGNPEAAQELITARESDDERVRVGAHYNLGLWRLIGALLSQSNDSIIYRATQAVEENKAALRLDPSHPDAGWNLSLARILIVEASPDFDVGNIDEPNGAPDLGEIQMIEGPSPFGQDEGFGEQASDAEEEAIAQEDFQPLTLDEASAILGTGHLDPSTMTGKLLLREGRNRRRRGGGRTIVEGPPW